MRVMVFSKADESQMGGMAEPTPEMLAAFKAMDDFTEELVKAGVFVAAAGLKPSAQSKRVEFDGKTRARHRRAVRRKPRDGRRLFDLGSERHGRSDGLGHEKPHRAGYAGRARESGRSTRWRNLAEFVTPEELASAGRPGERGKLVGVA